MANSSAKSSKNDSADFGKRQRPEKLSEEFFSRSTLLVAPELLGKVLYAQSEEGRVAGRIVETEAYRADDPASHSSKGRTPRAAIMFGPPARVYVYFIYGMYEMLNFVTEEDGRAGAVLIRAVEPLSGIDLMRKRRIHAEGVNRKPLSAHDLTGGPGKLCRAFGIQLSDNGLKAGGRRIWIEDDGLSPGKILVSPRIGISKGQDRLWRFFLDKNEFVSRSPMNQRAKPYIEK
jgi:DNA-3-methyladenine glycosylase